MIQKFNKEKAEFANTWSHAIALGIFMIMAIFILRKSIAQQSLVLNLGIIVFIVGEVMMFLSSTLYHAVKDPTLKRRLRYFDHCAIYVSIAGSYTPILLWTIKGTLGNVCFLVMWILCITGIVYKIMALGKHPKVSLALYLAMGWLVVFIIKPVIESFPAISLIALLCEGLAFTIGTYFFWKDETKTYYHAIWHLFIFIGCVSHYIILWFLF